MAEISTAIAAAMPVGDLEPDLDLGMIRGETDATAHAGEDATSFRAESSHLRS